jgi:hypothetical protein
VTPQPGEKITDHQGETWTLVSRDGHRLRIGRQAERGWWEQDAFVTHFPAYTWDRCATCEGPATRTVRHVPQFDCHPVS